MDRNTLNIETREKSGSREARRTRSTGRIPGVLYGRGSEPLAISLDVKELRKALSGKSGLNTVLELQGSDKVKGKLAILKSVQHNPVNSAPTHADLQELKLDQKIHVNVPIHLQGKAKGVVEGGIVTPLVRDLGIECFPNDIPEAINVDITELNIGDSLHVNELKLPEGIRAVGDQGIAIVSVVAPAAEKGAAAAAATEPTVLTAKQPAEGAAKK
jgi:large subunit ribosomal protein L25